MQRKSTKPPKIPRVKLKPIDLSKCTKGPNNGMTLHPDINTKSHYLIKYDGNYYAGTFGMQWYGLNFNGVYDAGAQFDAPGTNASRWEAVWEIIPLR